MLASDLLDGQWAMLWNDEQRGIGELMTERLSGGSSIVRGHAAFHRDYDKTFAPWMERFAGDLLSSAALTSDRLRLLQWALYGLVRQLDEEGTYGGVWIDRSASEIRSGAARKFHPARGETEEASGCDRTIDLFLTSCLGFSWAFGVNRDGVSVRVPFVSGCCLRAVSGGGSRGCRRCGPGAAGSAGCGTRKPGGPQAWRAGSGSRRWRW